MRFLVIPEDSRKDKLILEPILTALLGHLGFVNPKLRVCPVPVLGGVSEALKVSRLEEIVDRYLGMVDVFVLCVDRDAEPGRRRRLDEIERHFSRTAPLIGVEAWQEIETWALAGLDLPSRWRWQDIRSERDVKEMYFDAFARTASLDVDSDGGRRTLGREASRRIGRLLQLCPEDLGELAQRLSSLRAS